MGGSSVWLHEENELSALISNEEKSYLETLPEYCIKVYDGVSILFSHRLYPDFA